MKKILVTSALPYVNNIPHLGNLIGSTLSADVYARHKRLQGHEVLFVCGADEHGTPTEIQALKEGKTPQELCDEYEKKHKEIYDWFNISFDIWGRTHTQAHEEIVQNIFLALEENEYIQEKETEQFYDETIHKFLPDRYVEGICPHCSAQGARGDQCDACGKLIDAMTLKEPKSTLTKTTPIIKKTTHLFIDLPALAPLVQRWMNQEGWSTNAKKVTNEWIKKLESRAITRDLEWGISVPKEGYENKVFYVWFDAPIGYISIVAQQRSDWELWWKNPHVELHQFMAKDNILFHSTLFPATLLGTADIWTMVHAIHSTEYLNLAEGKFSKSNKTGIFGDDVIQIEDKHAIPADAWRYALIANRPETSDTHFSFEDFQNKINNELIANILNLAHRTIHFTQHKITLHNPAISAEQEAIIDECVERAKNIQEYYDATEYRKAIKELLHIAKTANAYFQKKEPWKTITTDPEATSAVIQAVLTIIKDLSILLSPITPTIAQRLQEQLQQKNLTYTDLGTLIPLRVTEPRILLSPILDEVRDELEQTYMPKRIPLDIRAATIEEVLAHPNADSLYLLRVAVGVQKKQLVAGIKKYYSPDELQGKTILILNNLKEATIRGEKSQGMILASEDTQTVGVVLSDAKSGERYHLTDKSVEQEITFEEFKKHTITSSKEGIRVDGILLKGPQISVDKGAYGTVR